MYLFVEMNANCWRRLLVSNSLILALSPLRCLPSRPRPSPCGAMPTNLEAGGGEREGHQSFCLPTMAPRWIMLLFLPFAALPAPRLLSLCSTISFLGDELILIVVEIVYHLTAIRLRTGAGCDCWFLSAATAWTFFVVVEETCHHHLPACANAPLFCGFSISLSQRRTRWWEQSKPLHKLTN